LKSFGRI